VSKGANTRRQILERALDASTTLGLEGLTLGALAKEVGMSKSGLYAHFASKEALQCAVLDAAADSFRRSVVVPAVKEPRGRPRLEALFAGWTAWATVEMPGGCPFIGAATEFDDRPGVVRERLLKHLRDLLGAIERAASIAIDEAHFRDDVDVSQFAYEFWANIVAFHHYSRLFRADEARGRARTVFDGMLERASA